jgi:threonine dehydrogenase-like Zn-dependent dehydrogenase
MPQRSEIETNNESNHAVRPARHQLRRRPDPTILKLTDVIIRISATCLGGSDLWPYCGVQPVKQPRPIGHEYCGIVEEVAM